MESPSHRMTMTPDHCILCHNKVHSFNASHFGSRFQLWKFVRNYFSQNSRSFLKNHCTNPGLVCTHLMYFSCWIQIWQWKFDFLNIFEKNVWQNLACICSGHPHVFSGYFNKEFFCSTKFFIKMRKCASIFASWHSYILYNSLNVFFKWYFNDSCFMIHCQLYNPGSRFNFF